MGEYSRIYKADLTDRHLQGFWQLVLDAGRGRRLGWNMPALDAPAFVRWMREPEAHPWIVLFRGAPIGLFLLTEKQGRAAKVHFAMLPSGNARTAAGPFGRFPATVGAGLYALASALWERGADGAFLLDTLIGIVPRSFTDAEKFVRRMNGQGFPLPRWAWLHDEGRNDDCTVTCWTRAQVSEAYRNL